MTSVKDIVFTLPSLNFKGGQDDQTVGVDDKTEYFDKYDPLVFCRTCANMDTCLVPIFKEEGLNYNLNKKIEKYLPIHVSQEDDLPVHLCYHCASTLVAWDTLIVGCLEAEKKLHLLKNSCKSRQTKEIIETNELLPNEIIDSDDEPLISKKINRINADSEKIVQQMEALESGEDYQTQVDVKANELERENEKLSVVLAAENSSNAFGDNLDDTRRNLESNFSKLEELDSVKVNESSGSKENKFETRLCGAREKKFFKCDACKKVFNRRFNFERHLIVHSGESFTCQACGKQYRRRSVLDRHIKVIHQRIRVAHLSCSFCGKTFSSSQSLEDHFRTHTGERPFICEVCGKDFRARPNLIAHKKIHTGELPFACSLCDYRCRLKGTFVDHCQRHEGTRSCLCSVCGKGFVNNYDLMKHKKTHSKERRFSCGFCHLTFVMKRYLKVHLKTHAQKDALTSK